MLAEGSEVSSKRRKVNEVKLMKPELSMCTSLSWIEDGDFPEWLLLEFLIRLPVKSVFRFKLVSKQWISVISKPYFVHAYVSRASLLSQPWTTFCILREKYSFLGQKESKCSQLMEYGMLENLYLKPSLGVVVVRKGDYESLVLAVSNGLVLYNAQTRIQPNLCVCNPLTGHRVYLPRLSCKFTLWGWGFLTCVENYTLKSFRVVLIEPPIEGSNSIRFQVFVSNIGEWKDFTVPCNICPLVIENASTDLNGVLHWMAKEHCIIAYDPYKKPKQMRIIALPGDTKEFLERQNVLHSLCVAYKGKLRYFELSNRKICGNVYLSFRVWSLNDYSSGDWCLQHNVSHEDIQFDANFPSPRFVMDPICCHPFDSDIVYLCCSCGPVSYNIKTRKLRVEDDFITDGEDGLLFKEYALAYFKGSHVFVIPHWPISVPMEGSFPWRVNGTDDGIDADDLY